MSVPLFPIVAGAGLLCEARKPMCSRYSLTSPHEAVRAHFRYAASEVFPPRFNIAPTQPALVVALDAERERAPLLVRWGLIPSWVKDPASFTTLINARAETVLEKPSFRAAMRHRRCLVPADGFYEWTGPAGRKQPHLIRPKRTEGTEPAAPIAFAGLWEHWLGADGSEMLSMAILTTAANATVAAIHDRMPVILAPAVHETWLDVSGHEAREVAALLVPAPDDLLEVIPMSKDLRHPVEPKPDLLGS